MAGEKVELSEVFRTSGDNILGQVNKCFPGQVKAYDPSTQTAHVQPMLKRVITNEDGTHGYESLPLLPFLPVVFPRGGSYGMTLPLTVGDYVWVNCSDAAMAEWLATGQESEPWDTRRHHLSGGVCFPGCYPDTKPLAAGDNGARQAGMMLGKDGGAEQIRFSSGTIQVGATASDFVALSTLVLTELTKLQAALNAAIIVFNAHTHVGVVSGPGLTATPSSGTTASPVPIAQVPAVPPSPVAASMVKAL